MAKKSLTRRGGRGAVGLAGLAWGAAAGIAIGTLVLAPSLDFVHGGAEKTDSASSEEAQARADKAEAEVAAADELLAEKGGDFVDGALRDNAVLVIHALGSEPGADGRVQKLLDAAGADPAGTITLTEKFTSQQGADELSSIISNTLPAGTQLSTENRSAATHAGESFADALFTGTDGEPRATQEDRSFLLDTLAEAGYLNKEGDVIAADAVVIVTDGPAQSSARFEDTAVADLAASLAARQVPVVVAYPGTKDTSGVEIALSGRGDHGVATQDIAETEAGAIKVIRALRTELDER